jgi:hypothetical protein
MELTNWQQPKRKAVQKKKRVGMISSKKILAE